MYCIGHLFINYCYLLLLSMVTCSSQVIGGGEADSKHLCTVECARQKVNCVWLQEVLSDEGEYLPESGEGLKTDPSLTRDGYIIRTNYALSEISRVIKPAKDRSRESIKCTK